MANEYDFPPLGPIFGLPTRWTTDQLQFVQATPADVPVMQALFNSNAMLADVDPSFGDWPIEVYDELVAQQNEGKELTTPFGVRLIKLLDGAAIGYVHYRFNAPSDGVFNISMFVLGHAFQGKQYGRLALTALTEQVRKDVRIHSAYAEVYINNDSALSFWFRQGFDRIMRKRSREDHGQTFRSMILCRSLKE
ncbi:GNAT family N-acetyltransferase [Chitinivorax sp. B]|uniref:GNAT family N-acetyltransferase n=1 Tax=Chitinivorax sp. B TaxID=2502235 RepID=UPI00148522FA|nr:GNAT family N-acetyltransferase [Chitinivorax sp. B]